MLSVGFTHKPWHTVIGILSIPKIGLKFVRPSARASVNRQALRPTATASGGAGGGVAVNGAATAGVIGVAITGVAIKQRVFIVENNVSWMTGRFEHMRARF